MGVRFPAIDGGLGLGVGLDVPWDGERGFVRSPTGRDTLAPAVRRFLSGPPPHGVRWSHAFLSLQPRDRSVPRLAAYQAAWDDAMQALPQGAHRAIHTTALDLGAVRPRARGALIELVNELCARHDVRWINEDVGLWSLGDRPLPYPLPPYLTEAGLAVTIDNVHEVQRDLSVPLLLEFPGFARGVSLPIGDVDAYDFFRMLAERTDSPVTLDVGHLLSWRWFSGHRGAALLDRIEALPLHHCFEIHLSGCEIRGHVFHDAHHGVLLDEQLVLLERLLALCPNVRAVTYEDPVFDRDGRLTEACAPSVKRLEAVVARVRGRTTATTPASADSTGATPELRSAAQKLDALVDRLVCDPAARRALRQAGAEGLAGADPEALRLVAAVPLEELESLADRVAAHLLERAHVGTGTIADAFPAAIEAWRRRHPEDGALWELARRFLAGEGRGVSEGLSTPAGVTVEEAFARFAVRERLIDPLAARVALARAIARAIVTAGEPAFEPPAFFRRIARGWVAVLPTAPPLLVAAVGSRVLEGPAPPALLDVGVASTEPVRSGSLTRSVAGQGSKVSSTNS